MKASSSVIIAMLFGTDPALAERAACTATPIRQAEAIALALLAPDAIESQAKLGTKLAGEWGEIEGPDGLAPGKRVVRVYATNATSSSSLIGHYAVDPKTAEVTYADPDLGRGPLATAALRELQRRMRVEHCLAP